MKTDPGHLSKTHRYVKIWWPYCWWQEKDYNKKPGALIRPHTRVELLWQKSNKVPLWKRSCQLGQEFHLHCSIVSQSCMKYEILIEHE
jgi:hypothetical protein